MDLLGKPHIAAALLYVAGAVGGFLAIEAVAFGSSRFRLSPGPSQPIAAWGNAHLLSAGGSVTAVWAIDNVLKGDLGGWPVAGFLATVLYLTLSAVQVTLAAEPEHSGG